MLMILVIKIDHDPDNDDNSNAITVITKSTASIVTRINMDKNDNDLISKTGYFSS